MEEKQILRSALPHRRGTIDTIPRNKEHFLGTLVDGGPRKPLL